jgi:tRNA threonylcarbamoyladenosine biosynthesis protein TsaB
VLILAVDTTTPGGSVALVEGDALLGEANVGSAATHSARLFRSIDFLLGALGRDVQAIDAFAVAAGPGSFTGIRIGLGAVKSLAFASGRPVAAVSTLAALASKLADGGARPGLFCPFLDAKKGEVYAALFEARDGRLEEAVPQGAYAPDEFLARLPAGRPIAFAGSGLEAYGDKVRAALGGRAAWAGRSPFIAAEVGRIGAALLREGKAVDAASLEPLYFRKSQAEEPCRT